MDYDTALVVGLAVGVFAIPAMVSAISDGRRPRIAAVMLLIAGVLIIWPLMKKPGGYRLDEMPKVVASVVGRTLH